ncbi:MAG: DUF1080 domain-containing protein [Flavobacteriales bacterium CG_4_8_14_3_um_filter_35_10]|nr:DUF1080 domain-containing protein [Zetaproteobacteria bacterium]OIO12304.1 MAG: hypothetical protein AUJ53_02635 [Flavobacteriaceae bacterium CG1_02_35_72]PIX06215.1 MAG: DUF1080 domain-containing protein [Flavobacteriales bacterium CG_4_8_14_3_um_filter_35_10]PJA06716.1 MAG: DUF1080 domain-containing protein [Flavobacteriales bacterium CG_4_10_14_0_2_um_filter_35_18]
MKTFALFLGTCLSLLLVGYQPELTNQSKKNQWQSLFNGKDLNNWVVKIKGYEAGVNAHNTFRAENGVLKVSYSAYDSFNNQFGHIFYKKPFKSYLLRLDYRFVGAQAIGGQSWATKNSGIMIFSQAPETMALNQEFPVSVEVQLLGGLSDGKPRPTGNVCTPGTDIVMNDQIITTHCINSTSKTFYDEQWIHAEVEVHSDSLIIHRINGVEVMRYSKPQIGGDYNTFKNRDGEALKSGYICLQSESHPIEFKKIEIKELAP